MTRLFLKSEILILVLLFGCVSSASAQVATGVPPFSSFTPSTFDSINNANLNAAFSIPILTKAGQGLPFNFALAYSNSVWVPSSTTAAWTPIANSNWGWTSYPTGAGSVSYSTTTDFCVVTKKYYWTTWNNFVYTDQNGTPHPFNITVSDYSLVSPPCGSGAAYYGSGAAIDGSGYGLSVQGTTSVSLPVQLTSLYDRSGVSYGASIPGSAGTGTVTDLNGNKLTVSGGVYTDTLGIAALTVGGSGTPSSPITYKYYGPSGSQYTYTVKYTAYTVQTNFGCSGITEYGATPNTYLVSEIDLPDIGTNPTDKYTFTYETTPSHSPNVTGRLASVTLPTGGTISYTYAGGSHGITCADGTTATLERYTPDTGSNYWTYTHTESGTNWSTVVLDPQGNETNYSFQGIFQTARQVYQGSTLLETVFPCYNGDTPPCTAIGITLPITQIASIKTLPVTGSASMVSETNTLYNTNGLPYEVDEYGFGSGAVGGLIRKTLTSYDGYAPSEPTEIQVLNGSTVVSQTTYSYNAGGNPTSESLFTSATASISRSFTPNTYGVMTASTDYNGNSTSYSSFTCGSSNTAFPQTATFPDSTSISSIVWNCYTALPTSFNDLNGNTISHSYDEMMRPTGVGYPDGGGVIVDYTSPTVDDVYTNIIGSTQSHNQLDLDGLGRLLTKALVNDPDGETYVKTTYDELGRTESVSNPYRGSSGVGDSYTYDSLNRITKVTHADTSSASTQYATATQTCSAPTYGYGYSTQYTDELGHQRQTFTDALGRVIETDEPNSSGTLSVNTCYLYDVLGDLTQVVQGSEMRTYTYDMLSRVTSATTPEAKGDTRYFYYTTSGGGLCSGTPTAVCRRTDERSITTTYTYDVMNRLTGKSYSSGDPSVAYTYNQTSYNGLTITNGKGQRTGMSDASGETAWSYDKMGRILTEERTIGSVTKTLAYTYNLDGSLASVTYPSGRTVAYTPSAVGRPRSVEDVADSINYVTSATYAPQGTLATATYGSNINASDGYDSNRMWPNNLRAATVSPSVTFFQLEPAHNTNGTVSGVTNALTSGRTQSYTYDDLNRWLTAKSTATSGSYCWGQSIPTGSTGYDRYGNLLSITSSQCSSPALSLSVNTYNQVTNTGYTYDAAGDLLTDGSYTYTWNGERLLASAASVAYTYDGDGKRVEKSSGTYYWLGPDGTTLGETNTSGTTLNEYVYFNGARVALNVPTNVVYYYFSDQVGTEHLITNSTGTVCYDADNTPLGYEMAYTTSCPQEFGVAGMQLDTETGNYHTWFRGYEPNLGRWMSPDPLAGSVGNPQSLNRYPYVLSNPMTMSDRFGLDAEDDCSSSFGAASDPACGGPPPPCEFVSDYFDGSDDPGGAGNSGNLPNCIMPEGNMAGGGRIGGAPTPPLIPVPGGPDVIGTGVYPQTGFPDSGTGGLSPNSFQSPADYVNSIILFLSDAWEFVRPCLATPGCITAARQIPSVVATAAKTVGDATLACADAACIQKALEIIQQEQRNGTWETGGTETVVVATKPTVITVTAQDPGSSVPSH